RRRQAGDNGHRDRRSEEDGSENAGSPGQDVALAARAHERVAATNTERTAFRTLQQHDGDEGDDHHQVNNDDDVSYGVHGFLPSGSLGRAPCTRSIRAMPDPEM